MESEEQNLIEEVKMNSNKSKYDDLKFLARIILNVTYLLTFVGMIVSVAIAGEVSFHQEFSVLKNSFGNFYYHFYIQTHIMQ